MIFFLAAPTYEECNKWLHVLISLIRRLGFNISWKKVVGPTKRITFLGVDIDTSTCTLSLGKDKLNRLQQQLEQFSTRKRAIPGRHIELEYPGSSRSKILRTTNPGRNAAETQDSALRRVSEGCTVVVSVLNLLQWHCVLL